MGNQGSSRLAAEMRAEYEANWQPDSYSVRNLWMSLDRRGSVIGSHPCNPWSKKQKPRSRNATAAEREKGSLAPKLFHAPGTQDRDHVARAICFGGGSAVARRLRRGPWAGAGDGVQPRGRGRRGAEGDGGLHGGKVHESGSLATRKVRRVRTATTTIMAGELLSLFILQLHQFRNSPSGLGRNSVALLHRAQSRRGNLTTDYTDCTDGEPITDPRFREFILRYHEVRESPVLIPHPCNPCNPWSKKA